MKTWRISKLAAPAQVQTSVSDWQELVMRTKPPKNPVRPLNLLKPPLKGLQKLPQNQLRPSKNRPPEGEGRGRVPRAGGVVAMGVAQVKRHQPQSEPPGALQQKVRVHSLHLKTQLQSLTTTPGRAWYTPVKIHSLGQRYLLIWWAACDAQPWPLTSISF
jgi:hypothetical protein